MATFTVTQVDHSAENTSTSVRVEDAVVQADLDAIKNAIDGVSNGNIWNETFSRSTRGNRSIPANQSIQREIKIAITLQDNVTFDISTISIGCAELSVLTIPTGTDKITLADGGVMAALVTALEATARSKAGNGVTVLEARAVGRNT